jgi:uracil permease
MNNKKTIDGPVYDARALGTSRMLVLGLQHMFAMFGATVLVPALTGLDVATTLLFAGLGTLLFHLITKKKVPAFLGSSFAFIPGYAAIAPNGEADLLVYACCGVACVGIMYAILSALFKTYGIKKVMRFFPPIVTGPIIIAIGLNLSSSAVNNCSSNWLIAIVAIVVVIGANDVLNPAARNAVGTPIYGMPVLNVDEAPEVIVCNFDLKPGYAGVENPIYSREKGVYLELGDAKETLMRLMAEMA